MKKLTLILVVMVMACMCSQSYAYLLAYNLSGTVRAADVDSNDFVNTLVNGFLVIDINSEQGTLDGSSLVLFSKECKRCHKEYNRAYNETYRCDRFYTRYDDVVNLQTQSKVVEMIINAGSGTTLIFTGRLNNRNIGLADKESVASLLDGVISLQFGQLFDPNQSLIGGGEASGALNLCLTRRANESSEPLDDVVGAFIERLEEAGYEAVTEPISG
jgi:hypothetical protein